MKKKKEQNEKYMTVGELAERGGVTIRTLQYYDHKGLLVPSAKGGRNQRLYTERDLETLQCILFYKYMGLSLDEIGEFLQKGSSEQMAKTLHQKVVDAEELLSQQIQRCLVLKNLEALTTDRADEFDWNDAYKIIDYIDSKWHMILQINRAFEDESNPSRFPDFQIEERMRYHKLIGDAINLMIEGFNPESDEAQTVIEEYYANVGKDSPMSEWRQNPDITYMDSKAIKAEFDGATQMWVEVCSFLEKAARCCFLQKESPK